MKPQTVMGATVHEVAVPRDGRFVLGCYEDERVLFVGNGFRLVSMKAKTIELPRFTATRPQVDALMVELWQPGVAHIFLARHGGNWADSRDLWSVAAFIDHGAVDPAFRLPHAPSTPRIVDLDLVAEVDSDRDEALWESFVDKLKALAAEPQYARLGIKILD